ncbi:MULTISPECIES: hypothetical protein [unclassified Corallococcus]|uniref:hypothetical protein n=1 Tax=unclassified Corallococcus TaxID=2685029 RepID=UPI001A8CF785|nr:MULTISPECIES: hypothetical protein [unclassified Corallococcus]MBN9684148.1 hypothetical protein [Corallococcus sp. NCSPR001]WAS84362.1 hypothetical protein O0N60_34410 [Corallococcus sp. NCRR]
MTMGIGLSELADAGEEVWKQTIREVIEQAFNPHRQGASEELRHFIATIRARLGKRGKGTHECFKWVEQQVNPWLRGIDAEMISAWASTYVDLQERVRFLVTLAGTPLIERSGPALFGAADALSKQELASGGVSLEQQTTLALRLVDLAGSLANNRTVVLRGLLERFPPVLLESVLTDVGRLVFFDYALEVLATSLVLAGNRTAESFAGAFAKGKSVRLRRVLEAMAERFRRPVGVWRQEHVSVDAIKSWFAALELAMRARAPELQELLDSLLESLREHDRELAGIMAAYLDAQPSNHEDVFNLFSVRGQKRQASPPSQWGTPTVTVQETGSMRGSSLFSRGKDIPEPEPADFDWKQALRNVGVPALKMAVLAQSSPEFALEYLEQLGNVPHPSFLELCEELCGIEKFRRQFFVVDGVMAAVVVLRLDALMSGNPAIQALHDELLPMLIERMPTEYLVRMSNRDLLGREIERRLPSVEDVRTLRTLLELSSFLVPDGRMVELLDQVSFRSFCPKDTADNDELSRWVLGAVHLVDNRALDPVTRMLKQLSTVVLGRIFGLELMGAREQEDQWTPSLRQGFKSLLVEEWARREPVAVMKALQEHAARDVTFWFYSFSGYCVDEARFAASAEHWWLRTIESLAPEWVSAYLRELLKKAWLHLPLNRLGPTLENAAEFTRKWLSSRGDYVDPSLWEMLLERLAQLPMTDGEGAAIIAAVELPAMSEHLHVFREKAVLEARKRLLHSRALGDSVGFRRLRNIVLRERPELWMLLADVVT